jgi:hypothetical protein
MMKAMAKAFLLTADQTKVVVPVRGACYASDRITVDGRPVGFAYRERPDSFQDSGWRFFAGGEIQEYADEGTGIKCWGEVAVEHSSVS